MPRTDTFSALSAAFLPAIVEAFLILEAGEWTPTRLGKEAVKDPGAVFALRNGRSPHPPTRRKMLDFIEKKRPGFIRKFVAHHAQEHLYEE